MGKEWGSMTVRRACPRPAVRRWLVLALAMAGAFTLGVADALATSPLSALTQRPANPTCLAGVAPPVTSQVQFTQVFTELGSRRPFDFRLFPGLGGAPDPNRFYYITRPGLLYSFTLGETPRLALDISARIGINNNTNAYSPGGSEHYGLVSFAFHPDFAASPARRWVFVLYNGRLDGQATTTSYVARYTLNPDGVTFDPGSELIVISQLQGPSWLHHFGHLAFGADGHLYISSGDGTLNGQTYFPEVPAQDLGDLRGKLLRLDVNDGTPAEPYRIPAGNPFAGVPGARPEIYAYGFRNPWRFSFDTFAGRMWVGDVGDALDEEVSVVEQAGGNYGWNVFEGSRCRIPAQCPTTPAIPPVYTIPHNGESIAVIGGFVYRGQGIPYLSGKYVFRVFGSNRLMALSRFNESYAPEVLLEDTPNINTFFTDANQEIYGTDLSGKVWKLEQATSPQTTSQFPALLSQTGCVRAANPKVASTGMIAYAVNSQLWSDGAVKRRWLALPDGATISIQPDGDFDFPPGSVLMKQFSYQQRPIETRLLKRHTDGSWTGSTYKWRSDGSNADLVPQEGETIQVQRSPGQTIAWHLPGRSQCMLCHTQAAGVALGPEVAQLNGFYLYPGVNKLGHQLATLDRIGMFSEGLPAPIPDLPALVTSFASGVPAPRRARSYLHANCSHCHRPGVDIRAEMDLRFNVDVNSMNVCNVAPRISDLGIPGAMLLFPQNPSASVIPLRMARRGEEQMPPLGTSIADNGPVVINSWIQRADVCRTLTDGDGDGLQVNVDNCSQRANASQFDSDGDRIGDRCDGDFNNDLLTDALDRAILEAALNKSFGQSGYKTDYDFNLDGIVNAADIDYFAANLENRRPGPSGYRAIP